MANEKSGSVYSGTTSKRHKNGSSESISSGLFNYTIETEPVGTEFNAESETGPLKSDNKTEASVSTSFNRIKTEGSVAEVNVSTEDTCFGIKNTTEGEAKVLDVETSMGNKIEIMKDGKFVGNVDAGVKADGSVVSGSLSETVGSEDTNAHLDMEGELLSGEVAATITSGKNVTIKTSDGKEIKGTGFKGEAGAEAYLAQGSVTGGFSLFGITFNTTITGKFGGAGAKVNAGLTNNGAAAGFDIGAGAGFGVLLSLDTTDAFWKNDDFWTNIDSYLPFHSLWSKPDPDNTTEGNGSRGGSDADSGSGNAGGSGDFQLRVTPEELKNQANVIQEQVDRMKREWDSLLRTLTGVGNYWEGDAGDSHREQYEAFRDDMDRLLRKLSEHPEDLLKMAGVYQEAENAAINIANSLAGDIIE